MRWGFRVSTDPTNGSGHLVRCRALAASMTAPVVLFADPSGLEQVDLDWSGNILAESSRLDADLALAALSERSIDGLLFDHFGIDDATVACASSSGFTAAFRDGGRYGPEWISIDPNPGAVGAPDVIAGPDKMPLAAEFATRHNKETVRRRDVSEVPSVMIAFGTHDSTNRTQLALNALMQIERRLNTTVVVGRQNPHHERIASDISRYNSVRILNDISDLSEIYGCFDLAIGAPGVSQFERACCGLPTILIAQNVRQESLLRHWEITGSAIASESTSESVADTLDRILNNGECLSRMREHCLALVDGRGAERLAAALSQAALQ